MDDSRTSEYRAIWQEKPVLRSLYRDYYRRLSARCRPGRTLEIGGGSGNLKEFLPEVVSSDVIAAPWLDVVADGQALPFVPDSFDNIVMLDVLHHIEHPARFFREAERVLRPGGRIVLVEPAITPLSRIFYTWFHPEPVRMNTDPLGETTSADPNRSPWDANQAVPTLLFGRHRARFEAAFPSLAIRETAFLSLFAFPLSGGFRRWSLVPAGLVAPLLRLEEWLLPILGRVMAFRLLVVLERVK